MIRSNNEKLENYARGFGTGGNEDGVVKSSQKVGGVTIREEPNMDTSIQAYEPSAAPVPMYSGRPKRKGNSSKMSY